MSYDVDVQHRGSVDRFNYTYNLSPFFRRFGLDINSFHGQPAEIVAARIVVGLEEAATIPLPLLKESYDPENGWGSVESAIGFLHDIRRACVDMECSDAYCPTRVWVS